MAELSGKVILITGASRGIGAAAFEQAIAAGGEVILHYAKSHEAAARLTEAAAPQSCLKISADLAEPQEVARLWDEALAWKGRIDVLVNNAAIYEPADIDDSLADWHAGWARTLQVNLQAPADLCRAAIRHYRSRGGGIIVNVTSRGAYRGELAEFGHYAATKGGLGGLTRTIARAYAKDGVLAYAVSPGWTATEMAVQGAPPGVLEAATNDIPLGELTAPEDVAEIITFLSSGRARHATGITVDVTGGSYMR
ncbi:MAG: SDR family oxidoreductase [Alphaproteobacteria bacterium]|jgi:NAD(P)-dependent dehydrogenase (short-subunit alcohol dehydrogenase family)|nr:SDR family oxidoreductase [Alphaproteobacteria bacterium]MDP6588066.1 SDR family oxidoreductase [Alphaproteobacteria bacterium]MDP6819330.1 SDR family oxidoreductase [Alphaproteobacteria bacterium]